MLWLLLLLLSSVLWPAASSADEGVDIGTGILTVSDSNDVTFVRYGVWATDPPTALQIAVEFIGKRERFRAHAYHDSAGYPTIGYGEKLSDEVNGDLGQYEPQTEAEAREWLTSRVTHILHGVMVHVQVDLDQYQEAALASLAYNIGLGALERSKLLVFINSGTPLGVIVGEWVTWDKEHRGGRLVRSNGLSNRRALEIVLYLTGIYSDSSSL